MPGEKRQNSIHYTPLVLTLGHKKQASPFSSASICSWVKDVRFLCSFLFNWSLIWASSESSPFELMELVFSPPPSCCWQPSAKGRGNPSKKVCAELMCRSKHSQPCLRTSLFHLPQSDNTVLQPLIPGEA